MRTHTHLSLSSEEVPSEKRSGLGESAKFRTSRPQTATTKCFWRSSQEVQRSQRTMLLSRRVAPSPSDRMCPLNERRTKWKRKCADAGCCRYSTTISVCVDFIETGKEGRMHDALLQSSLRAIPQRDLKKRIGRKRCTHLPPRRTKSLAPSEAGCPRSQKSSTAAGAS